MNHQRAKLRQRVRRRWRVSKRIRGTADRPRLCVVRSHKHMYAQIINDDEGKTLVSASTIDASVKEQVGYGGNRKAAEAVGKTVAERALAAGIKQVCFDRREFKFHGRVAALAEAARAAGLSF